MAYFYRTLIHAKAFFIAALAFVCFALSFVFPMTAYSQLTKSSDIILTDDTRLVHILPSAQQSHVNESEKLTAQNIYVRHKSQNLGEHFSGRILALPGNLAKRWLSFEINNQSEEDLWSLNFGHTLEGHLGSVKTIQIFNHSTHTSVINASGSELLEQIHDNRIFISIPPNAQSFFSMYIEASGPLPQTFNLSLSPAQKSFPLQKALTNIISYILSSLFLCFGAFFITHFFMRDHKSYLYYALYFLAPALLLMLNYVDWSIRHHLMIFIMSLGLSCAVIFSSTDHKKNNNSYNQLFSISNSALIAGIAIFTLATFTPLAPLSFLQKSLYSLTYFICYGVFLYRALRSYQEHHIQGLFAAAAWVCAFIGFLFTTIGFTILQGQSPFFVNAYIYSFIPQGLLLILGVVAEIREEDQAKIDEFAKKNRATQALARLQQSKDVTDQARLLRVIERERELMADLREQEAYRTEEMRKAKEEADAANAAKSAFLAVISHEIRTPMNGIMGILRLLQGTNMSKEQSDYILTMHKTGDTMIALLNDILDFEKIDTGKMDLEQINIDLHNLLQGIVTLMSGYVAEKDVELRCAIGPNVPRFIIGDPTRIRQVLLNLVSNAIKFTEKGHVTVHVNSQTLLDKPDSIKADYEITFAVEDTGMGISEEAQKTLFDPFQQADSSVARNHGGSGLGLAISMRLIEIMGSSIILESELGKGSRFSFTLLLEEGYDENVKAENLYPEQQQIVQAKPLSILVVEDNEINRKVLQNLLQQDGHRTYMAESGEKALQMLPDIDVHVVFMDINLTGMNGMDTTQAIRNMDNEKIKNLPVFGITGNVRDEDKEAIYRAGLNHIITKPINYEKIQQLLAELSHKVYDEKPSPESVEAESDDVHDDQNALEKPEDTAPPSQEQGFDINSLNPELYSVSILQNLIDSLGTDTVIELLEGCLDKAEEIIEQMEPGLNPMNFELIHARMHEMKGMCHNFGLQKLGDAAYIGEEAAKDQNAEPIGSCFEDLKSLYAQARQDFKS